MKDLIVKITTTADHLGDERDMADRDDVTAWPDLEVLDPDHPILERFQATLSRLLSEEDQQLTLKIIELEEKQKFVCRQKVKIESALEEAERAAERARDVLKRDKSLLEEETAKRLKGQELRQAKQEQVDQVHKELDDILQTERRLEKEVEAGRRQVSDMKMKLQQQADQLSQARMELDRGHRHRDDSQVQKLLQDVTVSQLLCDVEAAESMADMAESDALKEQELTSSLRDTIRAAHLEIGAINAEKIRVNQSWQSSLTALQRRHESLTSARQLIRDEENRLEELKKSCRLADQETHDLYRRRSDIQLELGRLERKMAAQQAKCGRYEAQKRSFDERSQNVNKFIKTQEAALRLVNKEAEQLRKAEDDLLDRVQEWRNKRSSLESAVVDHIYNSFASDQQARAIYDRIQETSRISETLRLQVAQKDNRNARLSMERDAVQVELQSRRRQLDEKQRELDTWDQIHRQHQHQLDEHQKAVQRKSDHLVKLRSSIMELETLLMEDRCQTEEQRQLKFLQQQLDECRAKTESIQQQWSRSEHHLLNLAMTRDHQALEEEKIRDEVSVLKEKKIRLGQQVSKLLQTKSNVERSVGLARDMLQQRDAKLADQLALKETLERLTQLCQREWEINLEEPERRVVRLRDELESLTNQKSVLEMNLCDLSKMAMLWACKLQEMKEAQMYVAAERSDAGSLAALQTEMHRLQVRQTQLQKEQESLNHQLEKIILGRSLLNCKADLKGGFAHRTRTIQKPVDGNAWHKILSNQLANRRKEFQFLNQAQTEGRQLREELLEERDSLRETINDINESISHLTAKIEDMSIEKNDVIAELSHHQKWWRFFESVRKGQYKRRFSQTDGLIEVESRIRERMTQIRQALDKLAEDFPHLAERLAQIQRHYIE